MSGESPVVELYSSDGYELSVQSGTIIPNGTRSILTSGSDGTNSRVILTDVTGKPVITGAGTSGAPAGGVVSVQGTTSGTALPIITPTLTKGTQNSTGLSVQDLKDSGRISKVFSAIAATGATTETLLTLTPYSALVPGTAATSFAVSSGKTLRIQSIALTWRNNTAAIGGGTIRFRVNATGAALISSPALFSLNATSLVATIGLGNSSFIDIPDGFELSGTMQFTVSQIASAATASIDFSIIGYEY